jgi:chemotaxis response regulator CheB
LAVVGVTLARQQPGDPAKHNQKQREGQAQSVLETSAALRSQVAKLRAEVELLELEHEVDKAILFEALKKQGHSDSSVERTTKAREAVNRLTMEAASWGKLDEFKKEFGDEKGLESEIEKDLKEQAERDRSDNDRKRKTFIREATELNEKRLTLVELERQIANVK